MDESLASDASNPELTQMEDTKPETPIDQTMVEDMLSAKKPNIQVAKRCEVGALRQRNEDSCLTFNLDMGGHFRSPPAGLFLVADGMGGHESGHLASKKASRVAGGDVLQHIVLPLIETMELPSAEEVQKVMRQAVLAAHEAVYEPDPAHDGGTTLTMVLLLDRHAYVAHVGDSRAYRYHDGSLEAITSDHSLVQRLQDEGQLTSEEAKSYQYRNILLRALGQEEELQVDTAVYELSHTGKLMLCSDGLCGLVFHEQLEAIVAQDATPDEIADQLYHAAMNAGGYDNITAVVVEYQL